MNVGLYARVSTNDKGQDAANQIRQLRAYVERCHEWEPITIYEYVDQLSGSHTKRPEFNRLFIDAYQKKIDIVMFWSLDRFCREGSMKTTMLLNELDSYGVRWKSFTEQYLDTCGIFKEMVISLLATLAKQERQRIQERVKAGMERYKEDFLTGKIGTSKTSRTGKNLSIGRQRLIFDRQKAEDLAIQGKSVREIARELKISVGTAHKAIRYRSLKTDEIDGS
jgi:DNA invertase Pin-like site-specific DNA recombinase